MKKGVLALDTQVGVPYFNDNKSACVDDYMLCVSLTETESDKKTKNAKGELLHTLVFCTLLEQRSQMLCQSLTRPAHTCDIFS